MSIIRSLQLALAIAAAVGCARPRDVTVLYGPQHPASGAIDVNLNGASRALSITVNDRLVVDRKFSRKARIDGVPSGLALVHVATGGGCEKGGEFDREVEVVPGETVSLALPGPEPSTGCAILAGLQYVGVQIGWVALAIITIGAGTRVVHK